MAFEFLEVNLFDTTTQVTINSNTGTVSNLINRQKEFQWNSDGLANDLTTASITIAFGQTETISRIALVGHNLQAFDIFFNGSTANTFAMTTASDTTVSQYTTNSETSQYFRVTAQAVTSVTFDLKATIQANSEKAIGHIMLADTLLVFPSGFATPPAQGYKPKLKPRQIRHVLSDGGSRIHTIRNKFSANLKHKFIDTSFRTSLKTVFDRQREFQFVDFGTTTGWNEVLFETIWRGDFDFFQISDNAIDAGFSGTIRLEETPI